MKTCFVYCLFVATVALVGCNKNEGQKTGNTGAASASAQAQGPDVKDLYKTRCASCHGDTGKGDGAAAAALNPKPRNFSDGAWQSSVKDEDIEKVITGGGAAVGKSALMPPNPDIKPDQAKALAKLIRGFKG